MWIYLELIPSAVIAGCWWFAAVRLRRHWFLYGLAAIATTGTVITAGIICVAQSGNSLVPVVTLSRIQPILGVAEAILYVFFVCWLVRFARNTHVA
jgi:hypothetical protein